MAILQIKQQQNIMLTNQNSKDSLKMKECNIFEVWEEYNETLLSFIQKRVNNPDDAKDIHQDILLKCYQFCTSGRTALHVKSWLFKVTQNTIIDYFKKVNQYVPLSTDLIYDQNQYSVIGEASDYIKLLLKLLPDEYAIPLQMFDLEDIDQKTIATKLNLTLPNTKSRIQRGRVKLKALFLETCHVSFGEDGEMIGFEIKSQSKELLAEKIRLENIS